MASSLTTARITGVLFLAATVTSILSVAFTSSFDSPGFLVEVAEGESQVMLGMLVQVLWALAVIGIAIVLYPVLRRQDETLALGFFSFRLIEGIFVFFGIISQLALLTLSLALVDGNATAPSYQSAGELLLAVRDWAFLVGPGLVFAISALMLNTIFYRSRLVPRWLSGLGLAGALLALAYYVLLFLGVELDEIVMSALIALQEMVLAVWLIAKGFNGGSGTKEQ
jgi:hypothetical protein